MPTILNKSNKTFTENVSCYGGQSSLASKLIKVALSDNMERPNIIYPIKVYNLEGKCVHISNNIEFDKRNISYLEKGILFVQHLNPNNLFTEKISVLHD